MTCIKNTKYITYSIRTKEHMEDWPPHQAAPCQSPLQNWTAMTGFPPIFNLQHWHNTESTPMRTFQKKGPLGVTLWFDYPIPAGWPRRMRTSSRPSSGSSPRWSSPSWAIPQAHHYTLYSSQIRTQRIRFYTRLPSPYWAIPQAHHFTLYSSQIRTQRIRYYSILLDNIVHTQSLHWLTTSP